MLLLMLGDRSAGSSGGRRAEEGVPSCGALSLLPFLFAAEAGAPDEEDPPPLTKEARRGAEGEDGACTVGNTPLPAPDIGVGAVGVTTVWAKSGERAFAVADLGDGNVGEATEAEEPIGC